MGFLNGLSTMGAAMSNYFGQAGLESQKADLQRQALTLSDQLQTAREHTGRLESADIAATAASKQQDFEAGQTQVKEAGATTRTQMQNDASLKSTQMQIDAGAQLKAAQARELDANTGLKTDERAHAQQVIGLQQSLADEYAKPSPDPDKIKTLGDQIGAQGMTSATRSAVLTSLDSLAKTEAVNSAALSRQLADETDKLGGLQGSMLDPAAAARQQKIVDGLNDQLAASRSRHDALVGQAVSLMPGTRSSAGGASASASASAGVTGSAAPKGLMNSVASDAAAIGGKAAMAASGAGDPVTGTTPASGSASTKAADGSVTGADATAKQIDGAAPAKPTAAPNLVEGVQPSATAKVQLPGDIGNTADLDAISKARPDLNVSILKGRNPNVVSTVIAMVEGRAVLPSMTSGNKNPIGLQMRMLASQVDPALDDATSKSRMETRNAFAAGQEARSITAANTALAHAANALQQFQVLDNGSIPMWNGIVNAGQSAFGSSKQNNAQMAINALASEARKVFSGSGSSGGLTELKEWQNSFPVNGSLEQQKGALSEFVNLMDGRIQELGNQYNRGMGTTRDPMMLLSPEARASYSTLMGNDPTPVVGRQLGNSGMPAPSSSTTRPPLGSILNPGSGSARPPLGAILRPPQ